MRGKGKSLQIMGTVGEKSTKERKKKKKKKGAILLGNLDWGKRGYQVSEKQVAT